MLDLGIERSELKSKGAYRRGNVGGNAEPFGMQLNLDYTQRLQWVLGGKEQSVLENNSGNLVGVGVGVLSYFNH